MLIRAAHAQSCQNLHTSTNIPLLYSAHLYSKYSKNRELRITTNLSNERKRTEVFSYVYGFPISAPIVPGWWYYQLFYWIWGANYNQFESQICYLLDWSRYATRMSIETTNVFFGDFFKECTLSKSDNTALLG